MNKDRLHGFVIGLLTTAAVFGLILTAVAAGKTIEIADDINVTMNGVPFTPKDANGNPVPLFTYDGTTYAPLRAICSAAGLQVSYDAATKTAQIETTDYYAAAAGSNTSSFITETKARELALADANVNAADAVFFKTNLDWEDGVAVYEVEFGAGTTEYDYELDATTGAIREKDTDCEDFDWSHRRGNDDGSSDRNDRNAAKNAQPGTKGSTSAATDSNTDSFISEAKARELALADANINAADATFLKTSLDWEKGVAVYEVEFRAGVMEYEYEINATTGTILKKDMEREDFD